MFQARIVEYFLRFLAHIPLPVLHALGSFAGFLLDSFSSVHRRVAAINIALCFPHMSPGERRALVRTTLGETARTALEMGPLWFLPVERVERLIREVHGEEHVRAGLAAGKGLILAVPHLGSWEAVGLYVGKRYPMTSLYRPSRKPAMDYIARDGRQRSGATLVPTDASGVKKLYERLQTGGIIAILPDQDPRYGAGVFAPFFGIVAKTMVLLPKMARRSGAPVVYAWARRLPRGAGFALHFSPAPADVAHSDLHIAATAMNAGVEDCVRRAPEQYQWSYKRFRSRPDGEPSLYRRRALSCDSRNEDTL
ncbi:lipid A biosynthesis acyltransferase [Desulfurispirillum indicum S5]|uniref:Lipid A biosynthesis acyltransferase n=1 Tax=Desulfurispirillum indicum (strain ATCC BAA-1389 / DSM 22839 / S5) TaxID=653733 RepID=E6W053_DESIS|nr:lysophospholipid acyltransferase family protein [Desulfurispirillum indicum]ADU65179.1 lipid A biosynthesis acyltransferase [Desulfurispirillum indicum S5]